MTYEVGQKVWCVLFGPGTVTEVNNRPIEQYNNIVVRFTRNDLVVAFTPDGRPNAKMDVCLYTYPVKVVPDDKPTKPSIDWKHVQEKFKWLASSADGNTWVFEYEPTIGSASDWLSSTWLPPKGETFKVTGLASYTPGTCDWKDSLVERPKTCDCTT